MLGCASANRPRRLTSHLAAKSGDVLTVSDAGALTLDQTLGADRDPVECIAQNDEIFATGLGDDEPLALAIEKLDPELCLQRFDLVAHRSLRDTQLLGRTREALMPGRGLEGLERIQRRKAAKHDGDPS